jgi:hypothetical protein
MGDPITSPMGKAARAIPKEIDSSQKRWVKGVVSALIYTVMNAIAAPQLK